MAFFDGIPLNSERYSSTGCFICTTRRNNSRSDETIFLTVAIMSKHPVATGGTTDRAVKRTGMAIMQYSQTVPVTGAGRLAGAVQTSDEALVQQIAAGDKKALQVLFASRN